MYGVCEVETDTICIDVPVRVLWFYRQVPRSFACKKLFYIIENYSRGRI